MSHYEERLEQDLLTIRGRVAAVGKHVERAIDRAVRAVLTLDHRLAYDTILGDLPINREIREIDRICHAFVARHLPSAGHLRFVSSVLRLTVALERVGDYAVAISREAVQLSQPPRDTVARDIELLAEQNRRTLAEAMRAFNDANAERARGTLGLAGQLVVTYDRVFADLLAHGDQRAQPIRDLFALLVIFNRLGRVGDQGKNICEETIFTVTGQTKQPKIYRILFVDERNDSISQMAAAFAAKAYPEVGRYDSAGWNPASALDPDVHGFLDAKGYDMRKARPRPVPTAHEELAHYHVIISLEGDARPHLADVPFHTVLLSWDVGQPDGAKNEHGLDEINQKIAAHTGDLMGLLTGSGT